MTPPTLTIAVPTIGRDSLRHTLDSIKRQKLVDGDRVLVVFDSFVNGSEDPAPYVPALVSSYGPHFEYHEFDGGTHFFGNPQLNHAMTLARTDFFCALGDDDVYVDGAFERLRAVLRPGRATLCQFYSPPFETRTGAHRFVLWDTPILRVAHISGCCLIAPVSALVPVSAEPRIEVDYDWIVDVVAKTGHKRPRWFKDCLVIARPDVRDGAPVHRGVVACRGCGVVAYLEDLTDRQLCNACDGVVLNQFLDAGRLVTAGDR